MCEFYAVHATRQPRGGDKAPDKISMRPTGFAWVESPAERRKFKHKNKKF